MIDTLFTSNLLCHVGSGTKSVGTIEIIRLALEQLEIVQIIIVQMIVQNTYDYLEMWL